MENHSRLSREEVLAAFAEIIAQRTTCPRRSVGAILVRDGRVLSSGYNGAPSGLPHCTEVGCLVGPDGGCLRTVHAEANTIAFAARRGIPTEGAHLWTTVAPCLSCAKLIINAGISEVYTLSEYRDASGSQLLLAAGVWVVDMSRLRKT